MKFNMKSLLILALVVLLSSNQNIAQNVGIGSESFTPDPSAGLEIRFSDKGLLPPRMSTTERDAITNPAKGLIIFNIDIDCLQFNIGTATNPNWICSDGTNGCGTFGVTFNYKGNVQHYGTVLGASGKCWLDRNLGATRVAQTFDDVEGRGDLFQWGRGDDGHQDRTSNSITTQSSSITPGSSFIRSHANWYIGSNPDFLWQGQNYINNPCPNGWRLPTQSEWSAENISNRQDAFESPLKLPVGGFRSQVDANIYFASSQGYYWTSIVDNSNSLRMQFTLNDASISNVARAHGMSVRCIKD